MDINKNKGAYMNEIQKSAIADIILNRARILEDFCKTYLALIQDGSPIEDLINNIES